MSCQDAVRRHYEQHAYPHFPLLASLPRYDTYALNLTAIWSHFNGELPPQAARRILIAGCGSFAPYPFALSNPKTEITALDLSTANIKRARVHCLLHGKHNVTFKIGSLLDPASTEGTFGLIDAFGVLHHLDNPLSGLKALAERLSDGGIMRVMFYSQYARRKEESIRRAFKLLGVHDPATAKHIIKRAKPGSRLRSFADSSDEIAIECGLADALLHPCVHTFRIDGLLELLRRSGLQPLLFTHAGALEDVGLEVERIRQLEAYKHSPGNFVLFLGRNVRGPCPEDRASFLLLNPCLHKAVSRLQIGKLLISDRLGHANPLLGHLERRFLRQFLRPIPWDSLTKEAQLVVNFYKKTLFILQYRQYSEANFKQLI